MARPTLRTGQEDEVIAVEERELAEGKVGPYTVMKLGDQTLLTQDGVTWEKVEEDCCTCAKFRKTGNCLHLAALFPERNRGRDVVVQDRSKKAAQRLKTASASQLSKQSTTYYQWLLESSWYYTRISVAVCLKGVATAMLWVAKGVDPR